MQAKLWHTLLMYPSTSFTARHQTSHRPNLLVRVVGSLLVGQKQVGPTPNGDEALFPLDGSLPAVMSHPHLVQYLHHLGVLILGVPLLALNLGTCIAANNGSHLLEHHGCGSDDQPHVVSTGAMAAVSDLALLASHM
jgi:hypothetical protein